MTVYSTIRLPYLIGTALFITIILTAASITEHNFQIQFSHWSDQHNWNARRVIDRFEENGIKFWKDRKTVNLEFHGGTVMTVKNNKLINTLVNEMLTKKKLPRFPVPVTAISLNHVRELKAHYGLLFDFLETLPESQRPETMVVYNLAESGLDYLLASLGKFEDRATRLGIQFEVRQLDYTAFPKHLVDLHTYGWKMTVQILVLAEFGSMFWLDASIAPIPENYALLLEKMLPRDPENPPCELFLLQSVPVAPALHTCNKMLNYLPIPKSINSKFWWNDGIYQQSGGSVKFLTEECTKNVHLPALMCSLYEPCIAPYGSTQLDCNEKQPEDCHGQCHRYDQSLDNLVTGIWNNFTVDQYSAVAMDGGKLSLQVQRFDHEPEEKFINKLKIKTENVIIDTVQSSWMKYSIYISLIVLILYFAVKNTQSKFLYSKI